MRPSSSGWNRLPYVFLPGFFVGNGDLSFISQHILGSQHEGLSLLQLYLSFFQIRRSDLRALCIQKQRTGSPSSSRTFLPVPAFLSAPHGFHGRNSVLLHSYLPASSSRITSSDSEAGPRVQIIFVFLNFMVIFFSLLFSFLYLFPFYPPIYNTRKEAPSRNGAVKVIENLSVFLPLFNKIGVIEMAFV